MIITDVQGRYQYVNNAFCWIVGYSQEELSRESLDLQRFTHPDDLEATTEGVKKLLAGEVPAFFIEKRYLRKDGSTIWVRVSSSLRRDAQRRPIQIVALVEDIRERKRTEQALRESEERFRTLADNISQLAWMADAKGRVFWYNKRWFEYTGGTPEGMHGRGWKNVQHPEHRTRVVRSFREAVKRGDGWEDTFPIRGSDGSYRWFLSRAIPIRNELGTVVRWFGTNTDITERRQMEEEVRHLAQHDSLTGLPNRRLFSEIIRVELAQARRNHGKVAILFLDLDRFKEINDTLGHETGDELLKQTAVRLRGVIRTSDSVARIGGDEFNVLIPDMSFSEYAVEVAQKILNEIRRPFIVNGHELSVSTSIGISVFPDDGEEIDTLMRYADIAMYYAKEHGRNMYQFYNPVINTRSLERIRFENSLRQAIDHDQFVLYYQPLVDLETRRMVSVEVLLRWKHPEQGLLAPGRFFGAAEEIGFMPEIDDWVLKTAGAQLKTWMDEGAGPVCVTVNLSKRQFESHDLVPRLAAILDETGLPRQCLDIEITEATAMEDTDRTIARLMELKALGIHASIDNFGVGYSSLNFLKRMQVGKLKIDRSFIHDIPRDADDRAIINGVLLMAHSMKMKVVASGVEDEEQLSFLREARCDEAQGYLFSEPLPAERFREFMRAAA
jgi:diguanylate cyclase (GGDEF)-like protein/PAS domain S-box-containing protein